MSGSALSVRTRLARAAHAALSSISREMKQRLAEPPARTAVLCEPLESRRLLSGAYSLPWYCTPVTFSPYCTCPPQVIPQNPNSAGNMPEVKYAAMSANPIRYQDGQPLVDATDLSSDGYGNIWAQARSFSMTFSTGPLGNHWMDTGTPFLFNEPSGALDVNRPSGTTQTIVVVSNSMDQRWFDNIGSGGAFVERGPGQDTLVAATEGGVGLYILTDSTGSQTRFHDFTPINGDAGQFISYTDPGGNLTKVYSTDGSGDITKVRRADASGQLIESWLYHFTAISGQNVMDSVKLQRSTDGGSTFTTAREVDYAYYDGTTSGGSLLDLASATTKDGSGSTIDTTVYRYWLTGESASGTAQPVGAIKSVFDAQADARANAAGYAPTTDTDAHLAQYATNYFVYRNSFDSPPRVSQEVAAVAGGDSTGGQGTFTYSYSTSSNTKDYNHWATKTTETLPDGTTNTIYLNYAGETMLNVHSDGTNAWGTFYEYDTSGRLLLTADPSAVSLPSVATYEGYADLLNNTGSYSTTPSYQYLNANSGLVQINAYYPAAPVPAASSSAAGGAAGYDWYSLDRQGESGSIETVTQLTASGGTATATSTAHGYQVNDIVVISGAAQANYNGVFKITAVTTNTFRYAVSGSPTTETGTFQAEKAALTDYKQYFSHTGSSTIYPLASKTTYGTVGGDPRTTAYSYNWYPNSDQVQSENDTLPTISSGQNGPGVADTQRFVYDTYGRVIEQIDGDGHVTQRQYDRGTGAVTQSVVDAAPYAATVLADGPIGYWRLGESSGTAAADASGNGNAGTYTGTVTLGQSGALANDGDTAALYGGGYTQIGNPATLRPFTQIALEAWVKTTHAADATNQPILTRWNSGTTAESWYLGKVGSTIALYPALSTGSSVSAAFTLINDGNWHQVVGVADNGGHLYLYVDGVLKSTSTWSTTETGAADWRIGGNQDVSGEVWTGSIDEAAVYGYPLSNTQIVNHYHVGTAYGSPPAPLALTTTAVVDGLGRTTKLTSPNGNVTYTVYNDTGHEVRVYPGFNGSTTTGPVQVIREYRPAASSGNKVYDETLTSSAAPHLTGGVPDGTESLTAAYIQSLSRSLTNNAGQVYETDDYFTISGLTYSQATPQLASATASNDTSTGNYHKTLYGYDVDGNLARVAEPTGTIYRTVYDSLRRVVSKWEGTNDTPAGGTGPWSPTNNGGTSNMVDLQDNFYDTQNSPAVANLSSSTLGSLALTTYFVKITYVTAAGETATSVESSLKVPANKVLVVAHPASVAGALYYNVYVGTASGKETLQSSNHALGSDWTEPNTGLVAGAALPDASVGDGNLTQTVQHLGGTSDRWTETFYDWRDRPVESKQGIQSNEDSTTHRPISYTSYDNLDEVTGQYRYDGDTVQLTGLGSTGGTPNAPSSSLLRAYTATSYDDAGRIYLSQVYSVDQSAGTVGSALSTNTFYDHRGNAVAVYAPGGLVTQDVYDGAGRVIKQSQTDGGALASAAMNWGNATDTTLANEVALQQTLTSYDADGNPILVTIKLRYDNDTTTTTGDLGTPTSGLAARDYYTAYYYDAADRVTDQVHYGTNGGLVVTRPAFPIPAQPAVTLTGTASGGSVNTLTDGTHLTQTTTGFYIGYLLKITSGSDNGKTALVTAYTTGSLTFSPNFGFAIANGVTYTLTAPALVTHTAYNVQGLPFQVTDPRGIVTLTTYDMLGRATQTIAASDGGSPSNATNLTTNYTYDGDNHVLTLQAVVPGSNNQTTAYVYGVGSSVGTDLFSNDLIAKTKYPNKSTGAASILAADNQSATYNLLGETKTKTDQNGSIHTYTYDVLGRMTLDAVTTLGSGVDGAIRSLGYSFDTGGRLFKSTSYSDAVGTTVVNQVEDLYNGLGQLTTEYQEHSGAVNTGTSKKVQYAYDEMGGGVNDSRLRSITYPNGRVIDYAYGSAQEPATTVASSFSGGTTTITVTTTPAHGLTTGDKVEVQGATQAAYNGVFTVTVTNSTTFTYTVSGNPGSISGSDITATKALTLDNAISRLSSIQDHAAVWGLDTAGQVLEGYAYLGLDKIVQRNHPQNGVNLTYKASDSAATNNLSNDGGDIYTGLDRFGRVVDQNWDKSGTATDRFQYGYDKSSNALYKNNMACSTFSELYHANSAASGDNVTAYDNANRLQSFRRGTLSSSGNNGPSLDTVTTLNTAARSGESWSLDAVGNQTSVTTDGTAVSNTVNSQNQLIWIGGQSNTFDNNGAVTYDQFDGTFGATTLVRDAWGRIASASCAGSYGYDALGRRVTQTSPDSFSCSCSTSKAHDMYYSSRWQVLEDDAAWTASSVAHTDAQQYVWGAGYVDDLVLRDRSVDSSTNTRRFVQQDANYNVTAITDASGVVQERFVYDPYGREQTYNASWAAVTSKNLTPSIASPDTDTDAWIYGFQGGRFDTGTGLYSFRNRDYSVNQMRWVSPDPTGGIYVDGANLYQLERSNPTANVDPSGLGTSSAPGGVYGQISDGRLIQGSYDPLREWPFLPPDAYRLPNGDWYSREVDERYHWHESDSEHNTHIDREQGKIQGQGDYKHRLDPETGEPMSEDQWRKNPRHPPQQQPNEPPCEDDFNLEEFLNPHDPLGDLSHLHPYPVVEPGLDPLMQLPPGIAVDYMIRQYPLQPPQDLLGRLGNAIGEFVDGWQYKGPADGFPSDVHYIPGAGLDYGVPSGIPSRARAPVRATMPVAQPILAG